MAYPLFVVFGLVCNVLCGLLLRPEMRLCMHIAGDADKRGSKELSYPLCCSDTAVLCSIGLGCTVIFWFLLPSTLVGILIKQTENSYIVHRKLVQGGPRPQRAWGAEFGKDMKVQSRRKGCDK